MLRLSITGNYWHYETAFKIYSVFGAKVVWRIKILSACIFSEISGWYTTLSNGQLSVLWSCLTGCIKMVLWGTLNMGDKTVLRGWPALLRSISFLRGQRRSHPHGGCWAWADKKQINSEVHTVPQGPLFSTNQNCMYLNELRRCLDIWVCCEMMTSRSYLSVCGQKRLESSLFSNLKYVIQYINY